MEMQQLIKSLDCAKGTSFVIKVTGDILFPARRHPPFKRKWGCLLYSVLDA